jgi:CHAT domain-containing protein
VSVPDAALPSASPGAALVSFYVGPAETLIFWLDAGSPAVQVERSAVGQEEIVAGAARLQRLFARDKINYNRPEKSAKMDWLVPLGQRLLRPVAGRLAGCDTLVVSPHGGLHALPVHLLASEGGMPLGVSHSVSYVANLSLYALLLHRSRSDQNGFALSSLCLATAYADQDALDQECFAAMPRRFAELTGGEFLSGPAASREVFGQRSRDAAILYLSCHGQFTPVAPLESALLLLASEALPPRDLPEHSRHRLSVRDILGLRLRSGLVILDACMSGQQSLEPGDEPIGFPTAFLLAGAGAVIASNWVVEQGRGREFMTALLEHWSAGACPLGTALRNAYAAVRTNHPHPFHWAPFSLFGNDRLRYTPQPAGDGSPQSGGS